MSRCTIAENLIVFHVERNFRATVEGRMGVSIQPQTQGASIYLLRLIIAETDRLSLSPTTGMAIEVRTNSTPINCHTIDFLMASLSEGYLHPSIATYASHYIAINRCIPWHYESKSCLATYHAGIVIFLVAKIVQIARTEFLLL